MTKQEKILLITEKVKEDLLHYAKYNPDLIKDRFDCDKKTFELIVENELFKN